MDKNTINVTKTFLPPIEEYIDYLKQLWESNQITNHGELVNKLENKLKNYLDVKYLFFIANGTIGLQIAIKSLGLQGEIITTPFSYVATTSSIVWEGCYPVFVDIDPRSLCIDPDRIEAAITPKTSAILATHVYGYPCEVEKIDMIAKKHKLKVIYDAAHTFGVNYKGSSLVSYGDISVLSFHATKLFHTVEGGALVTGDDEIAHTIKYMRNFGHKGTEMYWGLGVNGKNTEIHAAMGLCVFPHINEIIKSRCRVNNTYEKYLDKEKFDRPIVPSGTDYNYAYFPVIFKSEDELKSAVNVLNQNNIFPRRYFYPSLDTLPYIKSREMQISQDISKRVLCLPCYHDLTNNEIMMIAKLINNI